MPKKKSRRIVGELNPAVMKRIRRSRSLIAKELPALIQKDQRLHDAMQEHTASGALRRAIHSSGILFPDLAAQAEIDTDALDGFLTGEQVLASDAIDRLAEILNLRLESSNSRKARASKAI